MHSFFGLCVFVASECAFLYEVYLYITQFIDTDSFSHTKVFHIRFLFPSLFIIFSTNIIISIMIIIILSHT